MAETIREWVQRTNQHAGTLETLTRMSRKDLSDLLHARLRRQNKNRQPQMTFTAVDGDARTIGINHSWSLAKVGIGISLIHRIFAARR
jgi:hypothetical protein